MASVDAKLNYSNVTGSMGRVDDEKGQKAHARVARPTSWTGRPSSGCYGTFDVGVAAAGRTTRRSGCAARPASRRTTRTTCSPTSTSAAFGNNWVDYADREALPRVLQLPRPRARTRSAGATSSRRWSRWNLPPWRFAHVGTPGFYLTWMRPGPVRRRPGRPTWTPPAIRRDGGRRRRAARFPVHACCRTST